MFVTLRRPVVGGAGRAAADVILSCHNQWVSGPNQGVGAAKIGRKDRQLELNQRVPFSPESIVSSPEFRVG